MGGWSRVPPLSPLTFTEIGFAGPFFTPALKISRQEICGGGWERKFIFLAAGAEGRLLYQMAWTSRVPAMYLACGGAGQGVN
jgi:hypothetical protein